MRAWRWNERISILNELIAIAEQFWMKENKEVNDTMQKRGRNQHLPNWGYIWKESKSVNGLHRSLHHYHPMLRHQNSKGLTTSWKTQQDLSDKQLSLELSQAAPFGINGGTVALSLKSRFSATACAHAYRNREEFSLRVREIYLQLL